MTNQPQLARVIPLRVAQVDTDQTRQDRFAAAIRDSGLSPAAFAAELGRILGMPVQPELVTSWASRIVPAEQIAAAAELIAGAGSTTLPAPVAELAVAGLEWPSTVDQARTSVTGLWNAVSRGQTHPSWASQAATTAGWRWSFDPPDRDVSGTGTRRVTAADVQRLQDATAAVVVLDRQFGGGHAQPVLLAVAAQVTPLLHGRYSNRDGRAMFDTAAELTAQLGFSAYDAGRHGLAEQAYIQALRLAKAAGDKPLGLHILANLATQAIGLRRPVEAVQLAQAAAAGASRGTHPAVLAHVRTVEASAHAMAGDRAAFRRALHAAESAITRSKLDTPPRWARYFTAGHWAGTAVRGLRDLGLAREALAHEALALDLDPSNTRTKALHGALLATVHAAAGNVDRACELAHTSLDTADGVASDRVARRLSTLQRQLRSQRGAAGVADVLDRITESVG